MFVVFVKYPETLQFRNFLRQGTYPRLYPPNTRTFGAPNYAKSDSFVDVLSQTELNHCSVTLNTIGCITEKD